MILKFLPLSQVSFLLGLIVIVLASISFDVSSFLLLSLRISLSLSLYPLRFRFRKIFARPAGKASAFHNHLLVQLDLTIKCFTQKQEPKLKAVVRLDGTISFVVAK